MWLVVSDFVSRDGVAQAPGGPEEDVDGRFRNGGWSIPFFDSDTMGPAVGEAMASTEALLFGRRTFQTMAAAWPARAGDPFVDRVNEIDKYVVSGPSGRRTCTGRTRSCCRRTMPSGRCGDYVSGTEGTSRSWAVSAWRGR